MIDADIAFKRAAKTGEELLTRYKDVKVDFLKEQDTGEHYVRTVLTSYTGELYVSELYLGAKEAKK